MSSPIAKNKKKFFDKVLISIHKKISHSKRVELLSSLIVEKIKSVNAIKPKLKLLDVGCGDMSIAKNITSKYNIVDYTCIDIYPNKEQWEHYFEFDGKNIPFNDKDFDFVLFCDVLHHDFENIKVLLSEAKRVGKYIIIKDHFEYGLWSRFMLQISDFIGNYGYGVSIPKKYFSKAEYYSSINGLGFKEIEHLCPIQLYGNNFLVKLFFKSKYQFINLITDK